MANKKITELTEETSPAGADLLALVDDVSGTPTTKKVTVTNLMTLAPQGDLEAANNLSDLNDAATARTNLGLGTAATSASTDFSPAFFSTVSETTTARTLSNGDNGKVIVFSNANDVTVTLPNGLTSGFNCTLVQEGSGIVKVVVSGSAVLYGYNSNNATAGRYASINIYPIGTDTYILDGTAQAISPPGANALHYPNGIFFNSGATYYISTQPIMHFDADFIDGADDANNPTNGATLTSWGDRSGGVTNYDLAQTTASEQPTYYSAAGLTGVTFDSGDYFDLANSLATPTSLTQVIIATNTDGSENSLIGLSPGFTQATGAKTLFGTGGGYNTDIRLGGVAQTTNQPTFSQTDPNIHVVTKSGTTWKYWYQGSSAVYNITASYSQTLTTMFAGYFQGVDARIHEVLVFDSALSTSDLNIIKGYANTKYSSLSASDFS